MDWLTQNREWVFSGAGLFAISAITSLLSVVIPNREILNLER